MGKLTAVELALYVIALLLTIALAATTCGFNPGTLSLILVEVGLVVNAVSRLLEEGV